MDNEQAKRRAHEYLCSRIEITPCSVLPDYSIPYEFDPDREYLFTFRLSGHESLGGSEYIAVDRKSGEVRYLGFYGE